MVVESPELGKRHIFTVRSMQTFMPGSPWPLVLTSVTLPAARALTKWS